MNRATICLISIIFGIFYGAVTATAQVPGISIPDDAELSDQKPGSVLIYNYFNSSGSFPPVDNTEISLTNTNSVDAVTVRIIFVNGMTGASGSTVIDVFPLQEIFLSSDILLPGVRGYVIAVAVSGTTGCPIKFNYLIGDASVKSASGHSANLSAVSVSAIDSVPADCNGVNTVLSFNGLKYNRLPRVLQLTSISSRADGNDTIFILNRVGGDLSVGGAGAATSSTLFGLLYDDLTNVASFSIGSTTPQRVSSITNTFPNVSGGFDAFISAGKTGWMKYWPISDQAYLGASINFNSGAGSMQGKYVNGQNFSHFTLSSAATLTIPRAFPDLTITKTHTGNFRIGENGEYSIVVNNIGEGAIGGLLNEITVTDDLPGNLTLVGFSGAGWACTGTASVRCIASPVLQPNTQLPTLVLTVNVEAGTASNVSSEAQVSSGQEPFSNYNSNNIASDPTTVLPACNYNLTVDPASLPSRPVGTPYTQVMTSSGGAGAVTFSVSSGALPDGLNLAGDGTLSGTPTVTGTFNFTIRATDSNQCFAERSYSVTIFPVYEADVAPRPYGSGTVVVSDWVQVGRFSVGLDTPAAGSEFERADSAPRATQGDGQITVADWVQAGRYSVGLDSLTISGPMSLAGVSTVQKSSRQEPKEQSRTLRLAGRRSAPREGTVIIPVELVALGDENAVSFSIEYDPKTLSYDGCEAVGQVIEQTRQAGEGRLGVGVALAPGKKYAAGVREVVRLKFKVLAPGAVDVRIGDGPTPLSLSSDRAEPLPVKAVNGASVKERTEYPRR